MIITVSLAAALIAITPDVSADPCADVNHDGVLDNGDISEFVGLFLVGDLTADFNGDGLLDNGDLGAFVSLFLEGTTCVPELIAVGGELVGAAQMTGAAPSFLGEHVLAEPSVIIPVPGPAWLTSVLAVGTDTEGSRVLILNDAARGELLLDQENGAREVIRMIGDGVGYPVELNTLPTDDPEFMYEPVAARVHDGLIMVLCDTHWYRGTGDLFDPQMWDTSNTVSLLWKNIDDTEWTIVRDAHNPTSEQFGAVWAMGIPIIPEDGTLLVGWTNYQWKFEWNGPNSAFLTRFERGADGRWTHRVSVELLQDGSAPADQHFHTVQPHWTGSQLRVFIAIGDGGEQNGIHEFYRDDFDIGDAEIPKPDAQNIMLLGDGWTDAGYIHGGQAVGGFNRYGFQPTYMLPIGGRIHCGGDESAPAIASFDPNRPGGTPIDDLRAEYLPHSPDLDSGLGWNSLVGDVNDYANPTKAAALVQPSPSWAGNHQRATRVLFHDGRGWASVSSADTPMSGGVGLGPGDSIFVGSATGASEVMPGRQRTFTPLVSSAGATNAISDPAWVSLGLGQERATITDITGNAGLVGPNSFLPGTRVLRVEVNTDPVWSSNSFAQILASETDRAMLAEGDAFQFRYWIRPLGGLGLNARIVPINADTGEFLMTGETGGALATTSRPFFFLTNDWTPFLDIGQVLEPLGSDPFGYGFQPQTRTLNGVSAEFRFDIAIEGLYVNSLDIITQRPGFGESLPDTNHSISLQNATLPITVLGITQPLGASGKQLTMRATRNLCTLWLDDDNYLSVNSYFASNQIRYVGRLDGVLFYGNVSIVEWARATPVSIRFDNSGDDLAIQVSTYGGPWSTPAIVEGFGGQEWNEFRLYGVTRQSHLGLAEFVATPK